MDNWHLVEEHFRPELLNQKETIFTIGNGYLGARGAFEEGYPGEQAATLIHGVYDDVAVVHTELVNTPNWFNLSLFAGGERFSLAESRVAAYRRDLDLRSAVLTRSARWEVAAGGSLELEFERFASLADEHLACVRLRVRSLGYAGPLELRGGLPSHVDTNGWVHWLWQGQGPIPACESGETRSGEARCASIHLRTRSTRLDLVEAFHFAVKGAEASYTRWDSQWCPEIVARLDLQPGQALTVEKLVSIYTSRDSADPRAAAQEALQRAAARGYAALREDNARAWQREWALSNVTIEGDDRSDRALRYNLFQLLIAAPRRDDRVSIPAKSLSGYGYRGHIFWDTEIFILPFFIYTRPDIARNLLMYRYHTLPAARQKARDAGFEGALFAWESAATGAETTPRWVVGPDGTELVRIWCGDIEQHIAADVAYAVHKYWRVSGDDAFFQQVGAEIILDTARFWASRARLDPARGRYFIADVIGPDENHDHVDNNFYTNALAQWNLRVAFEVLDWLRQNAAPKARELEASLDLSPQRLEHWQDVIANIYLGFDPATRLFEQFEGYFKLKDLDLNSLEPRQISVQALLGIQPAQKVQVIKQPDVLMLLYLLEHEYDLETRQANWDYYTPRTDNTHGSSLGPAIQAILAARLGRAESAYKNFLHAVLTDLEDARGNSIDGIHAAAAGGVWQAIAFGFAGLDPSGGEPVPRPRLPSAWTRLTFQVSYHGRRVPIDIRRSPAGRGFPILGAIFDLDGVLTDTSELHYQAWKRLADEEGLPFDRADNEALRGIPRRDSLLLLLKGRPASEEQIQAWMERKNAYYRTLTSQLTPRDLLPGARDLLQELRGAGVRVAIGSASKNAAEVIQRLEIAPWIDKISDGYSVQRQKPAPDLFLHAADQLGVPPGQSVVFEDAAAGVEAGLAGGMWAVGVGPQERVGRADVVIPALRAQRWAEILARLRQAAQENTDGNNAQDNEVSQNSSEGR